MKKFLIVLVVFIMLISTTACIKGDTDLSSSMSSGSVEMETSSDMSSSEDNESSSEESSSEDNEASSEESSSDDKEWTNNY